MFFLTYTQKLKNLTIEAINITSVPPPLYLRCTSVVVPTSFRLPSDITHGKSRNQVGTTRVVHWVYADKNLAYQKKKCIFAFLKIAWIQPRS